MTQPFANRIVGYRMFRVDDLLANEANWRIHPLPQRQAITGTMREVGIVQNIIVNLRTSARWPERDRGVETMIDGHLRVSVALSEGQEELPGTVVDLDPNEERLILATLDPIAALAATDAAKLDDLLRETSTGEAAVQALLADLAERNGIVPPETFDPNAEWQGMPEFEQSDQMPNRQIIVNFASTDAVDAFARLVDQHLTEKTKSIWYPKVERRDQHELGYLSDES